MSDLSTDTQLALLTQELRYIRKEMADTKAQMNEELHTLQSDISSIKQMADRWRGATVLLLSLGSVVGAILSGWSDIIKAIR